MRFAELSPIFNWREANGRKVRVEDAQEASEIEFRCPCGCGRWQRITNSKLPPIMRGAHEGCWEWTGSGAHDLTLNGSVGLGGNFEHGHFFLRNGEVIDC